MDALLVPFSLQTRGFPLMFQVFVVIIVCGALINYLSIIAWRLASSAITNAAEVMLNLNFPLP